MIHVPWTVRAKLKIIESQKKMREVAMEVDYLEDNNTKEHKLPIAVKAAIEAIEDVQYLMDQTYNLELPANAVRIDGN